MMKQEITIQIPEGLEARPVALLVQVASQYGSEIYVESDNKKVNAKSIMGMMTLVSSQARLSPSLRTARTKKRRWPTSRSS